MTIRKTCAHIGPLVLYYGDIAGEIANPDVTGKWYGFWLTWFDRGLLYWVPDIP